MHFFEIFRSSIIRDKRLELPKEFTVKYGKELSDHAIIKIPNGIWNIGIRKADEGGIWLENGWAEFMEFYSICVGHLILFKYDGNSKFQVHIFGKAATEIDYPSHIDSSNQDAEMTTNHSEEVERVSTRLKEVEVVSIHSDSTQCSNEPFMSSESTPQSNYEPSMSSESSPQRNYEPSLSNESTTQSNYEPSMSSESTHNQKAEPGRTEFSQKTRKQRTFIPTRFHTKAFRTTLEAAEEYKSENPFFKVIIHATHKKLMKVPNAFANSYLRNITRMVITLRISDGRTWKVGYISRTQTESKLSKGWYKFVADNHIKEGDVCVFELVNRETVEINAHIFRQQKTFATKNTPGIKYYTAKFMATLVAVEEFTPKNPFFRIVMQASYIERQLVRVPAAFATSHFANITQMVITLRVSDWRTWEVGYVFQAPTNRRISQGWRRFVTDNDLKVGDVCVFELVDRKKFEFIVHIFGQQEPFARKLAPESSYYTAEFQATLAEAKEFTSGNPFFKIIMHPTSIRKGTVRVPSVFSHLTNVTRMVITLRVSDGKTWEVQYISRRPSERRICHGWREFVADNDLKVGDVCVFELVDHRKDFEMNVHIFRFVQDVV